VGGAAGIKVSVFSARVKKPIFIEGDGPGTDRENARKVTNSRRLAVPAPEWRALTLRARSSIVRPQMNGLNQICGICREIIS
jgi:hypothetical protein